MAIDDNTVYGLYGSQVKDLANKINSSGGGPTVVQTTGTSTTDVMSQNAVTNMVYADPASQYKIKIGAGTAAPIGSNAIQIGHNASASGIATLALGYNSTVDGKNSVALGAQSVAPTGIKGVMSIGNPSSTDLYNSTGYRLLSNVYDGQSAHDAATKGQLDSIAVQNAGAPTTATVGTVGQLLEDTTNGKLYICTDATNPYVWEEVGAGGGGGTGLVTLSYGNSTWNDFINAYNENKIVYCRASSNSNPATGSQTRMAFMAYINNPTSPTEVEFQYVRSVSSKTASQQMDQVFVYKLTNASGGTWTVATRDMTSKIVAGSNMTSSYSSGTLTLNADLSSVPTITMTTTDPGEGSTLAENNYVGVYGGDPIIMDYSTNEVNTGAKWIDGSAIYKKTINFGALPNTGTKSVNHNISNLNFVIKAEAYAHNPSGDDFTILPIVSTSNFPAAFSVSSTAVKITTTNDRTAYTESYITLYYTKSS